MIDIDDNILEYLYWNGNIYVTENNTISNYKLRGKFIYQYVENKKYKYDIIGRFIKEIKKHDKNHVGKSKNM